MLLLGNKIHYEEMNRVILHVMQMSDLDAAIAKIQEARNYGKTYSEMSEDELQTLLGEQVHTNQPPARIAPWFSFAGWGGLLIDQNSVEAGFRNLSLNAIPLLQSAVDNPPSYYEAKDKDDWLNYYVGSAAIVSNDAVQTSRIPKTGAENILLYGVPGAGKSYYIKKHYLNFVTRKNPVSENELITLIHEYCVYESFLKLGWLFTSSMPSKPRIRFNRVYL